MIAILFLLMGFGAITGVALMIVDAVKTPSSDDNGYNRFGAKNRERAKAFNKRTIRRMRAQARREGARTVRRHERRCRECSGDDFIAAMRFARIVEGI